MSNDSFDFMPSSIDDRIFNRVPTNIARRIQRRERMPGHDRLMKLGVTFVDAMGEFTKACRELKEEIEQLDEKQYDAWLRFVKNNSMEYERLLTEITKLAGPRTRSRRK